MPTPLLDRLARALGAPPRHPLDFARPATECGPVPADGHCLPTYLKQPKPGNVPTANGCGAEGGQVPIPQGYGRAAFTPACNGHDHCYENCAMSQAECDDEFLGGMVAACEQAYPGAFQTLDRGWCMNMAVAYWQAVAQGGAPAWAAAQVKACLCCEGGGCGATGDDDAARCAS